MQTEFGQHPASWYFEAIMQRGRVDRTRRRANRWNAYLSQEVTKRNESKLISRYFYVKSLIFIGVNGELPKNGVTVNISEIRATWNAMTKEEQFAATDKAMEELEEKRAVKVLAERKLAHSSFQDARHTAETIQEDVRHYHGSDSTEQSLNIALPLARSTKQSYWCRVPSYPRLFELRELFAATRLRIVACYHQILHHDVEDHAIGYRI